MAPRLPSVHCELAPLLINRTAVYQICRALPGELRRRGFPVRCSALLAQLDPETVTPCNRWQRLRHAWSRRWLLGALARPRWFLRTRWLQPRLTTTRPLVLDPLYVLFHRRLDGGVVVVYDVTPVTDPGWHGLNVSILYRAALAELARSSCRIVAVSRNTADHLRVNWGIAPSRLTVLPLGLLPSRPVAAGRPSAGDAPPFLLFVGSLEPRKNVAGLVRAYRASGLYASRGIRLRLVGAVPDQTDPAVSQARATPGVDLLGFVGASELAASYRDCLGLAYPSFCEGFGLPLLEAMDQGCVCLASQTGASPEVGGDGCLYVNPYSDADVMAGLQWLVGLSTLERQRRSALNRHQARQFSWDRFCDGLADILSEGHGRVPEE